MKSKSIQLPLLAFAITLAAGFAISPANACKKCVKHNPTNKESHNNDHGHEHLDEDEGFTTILSKGHTDGWTLGPDMKLEDGMIVAGTMDKKIPGTVYAYHDKTYYNFELRAQVKKQGPDNTNGGFQFRSEVRDKGQLAGYQADMGHKYWGRLYDQSRGRGLLGQHEKDVDLKKDINWDDWNDYRVVAKDANIKIYINGKLFTDYTEKDEKFIDSKGVIGLQLHGGPPSIRWYRNIRIKELD
ncbi:MAG: DUF1080 domain-containing protein [Phycisphaeraceae bacterium]|nr:DUF1080 domain-containing protein [Phycisphaeraceae bacterium]